MFALIIVVSALLAGAPEWAHVGDEVARAEKVFPTEAACNEAKDRPAVQQYAAQLNKLGSGKFEFEPRCVEQH